MNAFRDAVEALKDATAYELEARLRIALALGDTFGVATVMAELNARAVEDYLARTADVHDYEAPGYREEESARAIAAALDA